MQQRIKTNIKFYRGLNNIEDRLYGFVTKKDGSWRGCRVDEPKKRIVFVDRDIAKDIVPNILYKCNLIPMHSKEGFIAKTAKLLQFPATIAMTCNDNIYRIHVRFGNKDIIYDPSSKDQQRNDIQAIANNLRKRLDLENAQRVAEDFIDNACVIKGMYEKERLTNV